MAINAPAKTSNKTLNTTLTKKIIIVVKAKMPPAIQVFWVVILVADKIYIINRLLRK